MVKTVTTSLNHVTSRAYPLTPHDINTICSFLDATVGVPPAVKPRILLAYASFLRASNLTSPSMSVWGGPHTLRAADILDSSQGLILVIRSTKTVMDNNPIFLQVFPAQAQALCPVKAWREYKALVRPWPFGPAFVYKDSLPLTPRPVIAFMRLVLGSVGHPYAHLVTMHSLRRGGVQCAASKGATRDQLMKHGTWKSSSGLKPYLSEDQRIIPQLIAESLAN